MKKLPPGGASNVRIDNPVSKSFEPAMWAIATFLSAVMVSFAWLS
jgi:hypothetical protein